MMGDRLHIPDRDLFLRCICADLVYLRDQLVHQLAGKEDKHVHGRTVDPFSPGLKAPCDPVIQQVLLLGSKLYGFAVVFQLLDQAESAVRRRTPGQSNDDGTPVGDVCQEFCRFIVPALVHIETAQLQEGPSAEKRHGVQRFFQQ